MGRFLDPNFLCFSNTQGFSVFFDPPHPKTLTVWCTCVSVVSQANHSISSPISAEINFPKAPSSHFDLRNLAIFGHLWPSSLTLEILKLHHLKSCITPHPIYCIPLEFQHPLENPSLDLGNSWLNFIYESFGPLRARHHPSRQSSFARIQ